MTRILLVEPDKSLADIISRFLGKKSLEVRLASNAQTAITEADKKKPDIVVLELAIPKNNGVAFLQELRSHQDWMNIPVIIYSRIPQEDTILVDTDWQKLGVTAYLYKPTKSLADLLNNIEEALNNYEKA